MRFLESLCAGAAWGMSAGATLRPGRAGRGLETSRDHRNDRCGHADRYADDEDGVHQNREELTTIVVEPDHLILSFLSIDQPFRSVDRSAAGWIVSGEAAGAVRLGRLPVGFESIGNKPRIASQQKNIEKRYEFFERRYTEMEELPMKPAFSTAPRWVIASHNAGKIKEIEDLVRPHGIAVSGAAEAGLAEPEETETSFAGNALLKARAAAQASGAVSLADDSGLSVDALGGAPGVYSARWAGDPRDFGRAMARVHEELADTSDRTARFVCVLALAAPDGSVATYEGAVRGEIVWPPRGDGGFGYDPIFAPEGETRTFAEMSAEEKRALSHRARAFDALIADVFA